MKNYTGLLTKKVTNILNKISVNEKTKILSAARYIAESGQSDSIYGLIEHVFLGIDNLLVLRGDPIKNETYFSAEEGGHNYASELLQQVVAMNNGIYFGKLVVNNQVITIKKLIVN